MPRLSEEQKEARRLGIGASDIAELLGISPYEGASPVRLYAEKTGLLPDEPDEESKEMMVGHALEGPLVLLYERESNRKAMLSGEYVESVVHPQHAWKRCNLDGRVEGARIGLEVKVVGIGMAADWDLLADDGIPHYVRVQVAWQMHVADLDEVHVISLVGGASGFRVFYIRRDLRLEAVLVGAAEAFWRRCAQKDCPPLDASDASRALVEALYPPPEKLIEAQAEGELADLIEARVHAAQRESSWKDQKEILSAQIREAMGKAGIGVAWSRVARATYSKDRNGKPYLRVNATKEAKAPRVVKRNAASAALIDDGEAF